MLHIPNALAPSHSYPQSVRTRFGYGFVAFCKSLWHTASDWSCPGLWAPTWRIAHLARCHPDFNVHVQSHQTAPSALHASRSVFCFDYLDLNNYVLQSLTCSVTAVPQRWRCRSTLSEQLPCPSRPCRATCRTTTPPRPPNWMVSCPTPCASPGISCWHERRVAWERAIWQPCGTTADGVEENLSLCS